MYMIFVKGGAAPNVIHDTYEKAFNESKRLASMPSNIGKPIYITEVIEIATSVIAIKREGLGKHVVKDIN